MAANSDNVTLSTAGSPSLRSGSDLHVCSMPTSKSAKTAPGSAGSGAGAGPGRRLVAQMLRRKPYGELQEEAQQQELRRSLNAFDLVFIGIGGIIGTGIFVLAGEAAAKNAGPSVILSFIISGVAAGFSGLCYAELATMIPTSGSAYAFTYATLGEFIAWVIGWDLLLEYLVGSAAVSVGWSAYFGSFLKDAFGCQLTAPVWSAPLMFEDGQFRPTGQYVNLPAAGISLLVTAVLVVGVRESTWVNHITVFVKLSAVFVVICIGIVHVEPANLEPFVPPSAGKWGAFGLSGTMQAASTVFFAYIGFDAVTTMSGETKRPQRDLPIGILGSLAVCTILYILMAVVMVGAVPYQEYKGIAHPIALLAEKLGMKWLAVYTSVAALCGLSSVMLVTLMGQPRIFYSMAKDGLLPPCVARIHPRFKTPYITTIICGSLCALAGGTLPIDILADMTSIGTLFAFILCSIGVIVLRYTQPDAPRKFRVPTPQMPIVGWQLHVIPVMSIACCLALMASTTVETLYRFFGWLAVGFVIYFAYGAWHSTQRPSTVAGGLVPKLDQAAPEPAVISDRSGGRECGGGDHGAGGSRCGAPPPEAPVATAPVVVRDGAGDGPIAV